MISFPCSLFTMVSTAKYYTCQIHDPIRTSQANKQRFKQIPCNFEEQTLNRTNEPITRALLNQYIIGSLTELSVMLGVDDVKIQIFLTRTMPIYRRKSTIFAILFFRKFLKNNVTRVIACSTDYFKHGYRTPIRFR